MRRLLRWLWNGLTLLSLLLCVMTVVLWVRSYTHKDTWMFFSPIGPRSYHSWTLNTAGGQFFAGFGYSTFLPEDRDKLTTHAKIAGRTFKLHTIYTPQNIADIRQDGESRILPGPSIEVYRGGDPQIPTLLQRSWGVSMPYWIASPILALLPVTRFLIRRRWQCRWRKRNSICPICGYDLRATPERCPECGTEVPAKGMT